MAGRTIEQKQEDRERRAGKAGEARKGNCARFLGREKNLVGVSWEVARASICQLKRVLSRRAGSDLLDIFRCLGGLREVIPT